jgi:hypothetical protein
LKIAPFGKLYHELWLTRTGFTVSNPLRSPPHVGDGKSAARPFAALALKAREGNAILVLTSRRAGEQMEPNNDSRASRDAATEAAANPQVGAAQVSITLAEDLPRFCMEPDPAESNRALVWVNVICLIYLLVGLLGLNPTGVEVPQKLAETTAPEPVAPTVVEPIVEQAPKVVADAYPQDTSDGHDAGAGVGDRPALALLPDSPAIAFSVPTVQALASFTPLHVQPGEIGGSGGASLWGKRMFGDKGQLAPDHSIEDAVLKSLRYLKQTQNPDGSWGRTYPVGMTGLALLAFLGHGETPNSHEFGSTVWNALKFLLPIAERERVTGRWEYEHGIATFALAEAYGMTREPRLRIPLEKCTQTIIQGQAQPGGGWIYGFATTDEFGDMSISGWQVQALKAAHLSGVLTEQIEPCLDKAMAYVKSVYNPRKKGFGYRTPDAALRSLPSRPKTDVWSLTGTGVLCLQFWKNGDSPEAQQAIKHLNENLVFELPQDTRGDDLYGYYYATVALFLADGPKGKIWRAWDRQYRGALIASQNNDGSYPSCGAGAEQDKLVFSTALSTLMLEVWYRYDPTNLTVLSESPQ